MRATEDAGAGPNCRCDMSEGAIIHNAKTNIHGR